MIPKKVVTVETDDLVQLITNTKDASCSQINSYCYQVFYSPLCPCQTIRRQLLTFFHYCIVEFTFKANGEDVEVECDAGENLLEIAQSNDVEVKSIY